MLIDLQLPGSRVILGCSNRLVLLAQAEMHRNMLLGFWIRGLTCIAPLILSGCMTHRLWTGEMAEDFYEPSAPNRLVLFATPAKGDMLAEYDEVSPWKEHPRRRTYFVNENLSRIKALKKPRFVNLTATNGLSLIPLYDSSVAVTNPAAATIVYAITFTNENRFAIFLVNGQRGGSFELPTYKSARGTLKVVLLTPFAAILDVSIVGGVAGYFVLEALAQSGSSFTVSPGCR